MPPLSAGPISAQTLQRTPCRFGVNCNRGDDCPFDHTQTYTPPAAGSSKKPCTFVNLDSGCAKKAECQFSHELEGVACGKASLRTECSNFRCPYKHKDDGDGVTFASVLAKKEEELAQAKREADAAQAERGAALEQAEREASAVEALLGLGGACSKTPIVKTPVKASTGKTSVTAAPSGPMNAGSLSQSAGQKRGHENEVDEDGDSDDYTKGRPRKTNQAPKDRDVRQQNYQHGRYGHQQNGYGQQQQHGYQSYGSQQYGNQHTGGYQPYGHQQYASQQYGQQQNGYQTNGYQQRNSTRGRGRGNGQQNGNMRGRGNARPANQYRNVTAQANAPQGELKIKGSAAQHNP